MEYRYQLIFLGHHASKKSKIEQNLLRKLKELNLPINIVSIIDSVNYSEYKGNQPAFALYFGDKKGNFKDLDITKELVDDGTMILPIYFKKDKFSKEIPNILHEQNAICYNDKEIDRIVNIILEAFELLRNTRKIFISYKRNESSPIAIQLYEALESYNYDVFLDTHSIPKGEPFQEELWHRMTDCDVIILLNTPHFFESQWCKEEFAEANTKQIGIVQLVWPDSNLNNSIVKSMGNNSHISFPIKLNSDDFINNISNDENVSKLKKETIDKVIQKVESVRARNLASRQDNLITDFRCIAKECGREITIQPEKFLTEDTPSGQRIVYIPTIGIPQSISCQSAELKKELYGHDNISIRLLYDDLRIRKKWLNHLDWLNDSLKQDVKTLKKQDFKKWLQKK